MVVKLSYYHPKPNSNPSSKTRGGKVFQQYRVPNSSALNKKLSCHATLCVVKSFAKSLKVEITSMCNACIIIHCKCVSILYHC